MFSFVFSFAAMIIGLIFRLSFTFGLMVLKIAFSLGKSLFEIFALICQGIGGLAAKGYKALAAARKRRHAAKQDIIAT